MDVFLSGCAFPFSHAVREKEADVVAAAWPARALGLLSFTGAVPSAAIIAVSGTNTY